MTKTAADARGAVLPALGAAAALSAMLFASRLPVTLDFILPRRAGWPLFALGFEALSRPGPRGVFSALVALLFAGSLARFVFLLAAAARGRKWTPRDFLARGFAAALVLALLKWSFSIWFELSQKVWFPFGALNVLEPFANFLFCALIAFQGMRTTLAFFAARPPSALRTLLPWTVANALAAAAAAVLYGAWSPPPASAGERRLFVVLTEEDGRPGQAAYDLPVPADADSAEAGLARAGVRRLETLRTLYETRAKLMDPAGLRRALLLGVKYGDDLARALLLESLSAAPPEPGALGALGALADDTVHRIGSAGASRIALAYAHLGDADRAAAWAGRGAEGPRGIPAGLLDLSGGGALGPGRISGTVAGLKPRTIGLYRKSGPGALYWIDAAGLVASAAPDAKGRFVFAGLSAGRYYLAFAFSPDQAARGELRVSGHRGDLSLDARKTFLDLPPLKTSRAAIFLQ